MEGKGAGVWATTAAVRSWTGYKDNVLLSSFAPVASALGGLGGDFIVTRLADHGPRVSWFVSADYTCYFEAEKAEPETFAMSQAEVLFDVGARWEAGARAQYVFMHQVFDASETEAAVRTLMTEGHTLTLTAVSALELGRGWRLELEAGGSRQIYSAPLDSYWELDPRVRLARTFAPDTEAALSYRFRPRAYEERSPFDANGQALEGSLRFERHEWELRGSRQWGPDRRWSTQLRLGYHLNTDNGDAYFEFERFSLVAEARYRHGPWTILVEGRTWYTQYAVQREAGPSSPPRHRLELSGLVRMEYALAQHGMLFAQYERESTLENLPGADYDVNGLSVGIEWEL